MRLTLLLLTAAASLAAAYPAPARARTLEVGQGRAYAQPSDAIKAAHDGDTVMIGPGEYFDCAVVPQSNLTIAGAGAADAVVMTDKTCQGKALLVIDGSGVTVKNLTLTRARVPDENGAGIRAEGGDLTVDGVRFVNNQDGILAADNPNATILIRNSLFDRNGFCGHACSHGIYINHVKLLRVEHSTFTATKQGHGIKSRAQRTEVSDTTIEDGPNGTSSYLIDIPSGGSLVVRGCTLQKGPNAENHTAAIEIGAEGITQPTKEIVVENNSFRNDGDYPTSLVWNLTATEAVVRGNKVQGTVKLLTGDGQAS